MKPLSKEISLKQAVIEFIWYDGDKNKIKISGVTRNLCLYVGRPVVFFNS